MSDGRHRYLEVADWRRRIAELYEAVRCAPDAATGHDVWRRGRDDLFGTHPQSPLAAGDRLRASGLPYWPYDPALRFTVPLGPAEPEQFHVDTGADGTTTLERVGCVELPEVGTLDVWWLGQYGGGLFLPLRDGTAGSTSYGGGRYLLDTAKGADLGGRHGTVVVDLNFAYHPSCRYDPAWTCPLAPTGNQVATPVQAGERMPETG